MAALNYPPQIKEAIRLDREGKRREGRDCLRDFLLAHQNQVDALLWLAKITPDPQEAVAAAELALKLDPGNEVARRAVRAVRIGLEPQAPLSPLRVVSGNRYAERQERFSIASGSFVLGVILVLFVEAILLLVIYWVLILGFGWELPRWVFLIPPAVMCGLWILIRPAELAVDEADHYRQGRWGEERVVDALRFALNGRWTLFRNFEWPENGGGDVDLILVGPGGVWAIEVKAYTGEVRNVRDGWQKRGRWGWRRLSKHPGRQARRNAKHLKEYLNSQGITLSWVDPAIVWADEQGTLTIHHPVTPVWKLGDLEERGENLWRGRALSKENVQRVVQVLQQAINKDK